MIRGRDKPKMSGNLPMSVVAANPWIVAANPWPSPWSAA